MAKKAYLVLQNGQAFEGLRFGAEGGAVGELVFTTGMTGYVETLSDPSYYGQVVMQTFPLMGNYGMIPEDMESERSWMKAYIVREWCEMPSNFRNQGTLDSFLKEQNIPGLYGLDTRAITRIIREAGVMNACIVDDPKESAAQRLSAYAIKDAVAAVSGSEQKVFQPEGEMRYRVALLDCGAKRSIARALCARGCEVVQVPYNTSAEQILALNPNGVMLSNGPGDPAENTGVIKEIAALAGKIPIFGICLGHQLLALACGAKTEKLKYGHRGANQPVRDQKNGRVYITSQNHGYAVDSGSLQGTGGTVRMVNANDGTCEGVEYKDLNAFSVQFHPEACGGPQDTQVLFNRFLNMMGGESLADQD